MDSTGTPTPFGYPFSPSTPSMTPPQAQAQPPTVSTPSTRPLQSRQPSLHDTVVTQAHAAQHSPHANGFGQGNRQSRAPVPVPAVTYSRTSNPDIYVSSTGLRVWRGNLVSIYTGLKFLDERGQPRPGASREDAENEYRNVEQWLKQRAQRSQSSAPVPTPLPVPARAPPVSNAPRTGHFNVEFSPEGLRVWRGTNISVYADFESINPRGERVEGASPQQYAEDRQKLVKVLNCMTGEEEARKRGLGQQQQREVPVTQQQLAQQSRQVKQEQLDQQLHGRPQQSNAYSQSSMNSPVLTFNQPQPSYNQAQISLPQQQLQGWTQPVNAHPQLHSNQPPPSFNPPQQTTHHPHQRSQGHRFSPYPQSSPNPPSNIPQQQVAAARRHVLGTVTLGSETFVPEPQPQRPRQRKAPTQPQSHSPVNAPVAAEVNVQAEAQDIEMTLPVTNNDAPRMSEPAIAAITTTTTVDETPQVSEPIFTLDGLDTLLPPAPIEGFDFEFWLKGTEDAAFSLESWEVPYEVAPEHPQ